MTADTYQAMRKEGKSAKSEEYYYAYLLNDRMTDDELKDELKELEFQRTMYRMHIFKNTGTGHWAERMSFVTVFRSW